MKLIKALSQLSGSSGATKYFRFRNRNWDLGPETVDLGSGIVPTVYKTRAQTTRQLFYRKRDNCEHRRKLWFELISVIIRKSFDTVATSWLHKGVLVQHNFSVSKYGGESLTSDSRVIETIINQIKTVQQWWLILMAMQRKTCSDRFDNDASILDKMINFIEDYSLHREDKPFPSPLGTWPSGFGSSLKNNSICNL